MKCLSCGAEIQNGICEFCGSKMPQEKENINIPTNLNGDTTQQSNNESSVGKCPKCGSAKIIFNRERVETTTQLASHKNVAGSGMKGQSVVKVVYRTVGLCQNCGYTWNPNAKSANGGKKGDLTWLWVLGWIFMFPLPLTLLLLRKNDMKPALKYGIIVATWLLYYIFGLIGDSENTTDTSSTPTENTQVEKTVSPMREETAQSTVRIESSETDEVVDVDSYITNILKQYNLQTTEQFVFVEDFIPSDKSSSHYRTEFRLEAYDDSVGKSYLLGDKVVDLVA